MSDMEVLWHGQHELNRHILPTAGTLLKPWDPGSRLSLANWIEHGVTDGYEIVSQRALSVQLAQRKCLQATI